LADISGGACAAASAVTAAVGDKVQGGMLGCGCCWGNKNQYNKQKRYSMWDGDPSPGTG